MIPSLTVVLPFLENWFPSFPKNFLRSDNVQMRTLDEVLIKDTLAKSRGYRQKSGMRGREAKLGGLNFAPGFSGGDV